jgi:transcriptional regulator with XRE-family HTH domain
MYIKILRQKKHLSQEDLAELSDLSLRTIQRAESGHRVSYASLRALASAFDIQVDTLEQKLYSMDNTIKEYKDSPFWLRLYLGSGWFTASRLEFKKIEVFFITVAIILSALWVVTSNMDIPVYRFAMFGSLCSFLGAYNISISIRIGDKYDIWSKLEATLPNSIFSKVKRNWRSR